LQWRTGFGAGGFVRGRTAVRRFGQGEFWAIVELLVSEKRMWTGWRVSWCIGASTSGCVTWQVSVIPQSRGSESVHGARMGASSARTRTRFYLCIGIARQPSESVPFCKWGRTKIGLSFGIWGIFQGNLQLSWARAGRAGGYCVRIDREMDSAKSKQSRARMPTIGPGKAATPPKNVQFCKYGTLPRKNNAP
jgi:hypothetical protein